MLITFFQRVDNGVLIILVFQDARFYGWEVPDSIPHSWCVSGFQTMQGYLATNGEMKAPR